MPTNQELQSKIKELEARNRELLSSTQPLEQQVKVLQEKESELTNTILSLRKELNTTRKNLEGIMVEPTSISQEGTGDTWNAVVAAYINAQVSNGFGMSDIEKLSKYAIPKAIQIADEVMHQIELHRKARQEPIPSISQLVPEGTDPMKDLQL